MNFDDIIKLYRLSCVELNSPELFEEFLSKVLSGEVDDTFEFEGIIICKVAATLKENPQFVNSIGKLLTLESERSKPILKGLVSALFEGYVDAQSTYLALKEKFFEFIVKHPRWVSFVLSNSILYIAQLLHNYMNSKEKEAIYKCFGSNLEGKHGLKMIINDYESVDKKLLAKNLLMSRITSEDIEDIEGLDKNIYIKVLVDTVMYLVESDDYTNFCRGFPVLVKSLSIEDFRMLSQEVKKRLSSENQLPSTGPIGFLAYVLDVIQKFHIDLSFIRNSKSKAYNVDFFINEVAFLIPYFERDKFWSFVSYIKSLVGKKSVCMAYFLNNDAVLEDEEFTLSALKSYLESDEKRKLEGHKLFLDSQIVRKLSAKHAMRVAKRSVNGTASIRFKFSREAFEIVKTKYASVGLTGDPSWSKQEFEKFISLAEVV